MLKGVAFAMATVGRAVINGLAARLLMVERIEAMKAKAS